MKSFLKYFVPVLFIVSLLFVSCEYEFIVPEELPPVDTTVVVSFDTIIAPIFAEQGCTGCHSGGTAPNLSQGNEYVSIVPDLVNLVDPELSTIYTKPHPDGDHFNTYTPLQAQDILQWITQGALDN